VAIFKQEQESEPQDTFVENRDPTELAMCVILAAAYLGLASYCAGPLLAAHNYKLFFNVEGFFIVISLVSIMVGARPYMTPSWLQISTRGIKYQGPYWIFRKTVNWEQVTTIWVSAELIIVLYQPDPKRTRKWPMFIASVYLAEKEKIPEVIARYAPVQPEVMTNPALYSRLLMGCLFLLAVVWILEMLMS
jgi:hypothetical protein